jgi:hypothetical protein
MNQKQKIINALIDSEWVCTSDLYALYIADVRRRLIDLKNDGYILTSKKCELHDYHKGGSKMWHLIGSAIAPLRAQTQESAPRSDLHLINDIFNIPAPITQNSLFSK